MSEAVKAPRRQPLQLVGVIVATASLLNIAFWLMSSFYVKDKPQVALELTSIRIAFGTLSVVVSGMSFVAALAPRLIGHGLAGITAIAALVGGVSALIGTLPPVLGVTMLVLGLVLPLLVWGSLIESRSAWAFLISILTVLAVVTFFGAPKVRHVLGIGLWHALIIPGLMTVAVIALSMLRDEYRSKA
jgi:hypothetical protein